MGVQWRLTHGARLPGLLKHGGSLPVVQVKGASAHTLVGRDGGMHARRLVGGGGQRGGGRR